MQDIKMLRPEQVRLGRQNRDLCIRLKDDIEKAHREYDRRFKPIMDHPVDYFYRWLVEILAEGDAHALGDYPYATPARHHYSDAERQLFWRFRARRIILALYVTFACCVDAYFRVVIRRDAGRRCAIVEAPPQIEEAQVTSLPHGMQAGNVRAASCGRYAGRRSHAKRTFRACPRAAQRRARRIRKTFGVRRKERHERLGRARRARSWL